MPTKRKWRTSHVVVVWVLLAVVMTCLTSGVWYLLLKNDLIPINSKKTQQCGIQDEFDPYTLQSLPPNEMPADHVSSTSKKMTPEMEAIIKRFRAANRKKLFKKHMEIVNEINNASDLPWKAKLNPSATFVADVWKLSGLVGDDFRNMTSESDKPRNDVKTMSANEYWKTVTTAYQIFMFGRTALPEHFDARDKWPFCQYLHVPTLNQGGCGSCWTVGTTSAISDRLCIHTKGAVQVQLSAQDLLSCCSKIKHNGCRGGHAPSVVDCYRDEGLVSGGEYGTIDGCMPYRFSSDCGGPCDPGKYMVAKKFECTRTCRPGYPKTYEESKHFGSKSYYVTTSVSEKNETEWRKEEAIIMEEIMTRGPVTGCFEVYEEFLHYASGVYKSSYKGYKLYGHCVKIIGWGSEKGIPYWIVSNSWGRDWGDNGFFKLYRFMNHLKVEDFVVAGMPNLTQYERKADNEL